MDPDWVAETVLKLAPAEGVDPIVALFDYGIDAGSLRLVKVRKAIAPYLIDHREEGFGHTIVVKEEKAN
jgi:hypothetical protein